MDPDFMAECDIVPVVPIEDGKSSSSSKQISPAKHWCFTWNNYPSDWFEQFQERSSKVLRFVGGREVGKLGTPHIQGYLELKNKGRTIAEFPRGIHWGKTRNIKKSIPYCMKDGDYERFGKWPEEIEVLKREQLFPWQEEVVQLVEGPRSKTDIHWYWEPEGGTGKTQLCKYLCTEHDAIICAGKASDIKFMIVQYHKENGEWPKIVVMDIPRKQVARVSYTGLEQVKNGLFSSTKYECCMVVMNSPHLLCFANDEPDMMAMSAHKWKVHAVPERGTDAWRHTDEDYCF